MPCGKLLRGWFLGARLVLERDSLLGRVRSARRVPGGELLRRKLDRGNAVRCRHVLPLQLGGARAVLGGGDAVRGRVRMARAVPGGELLQQFERSDAVPGGELLR